MKNNKNFKNFIKEIKDATKKECYEFKVLKGEPGLLDSKIGGEPYIPVGKSQPYSSKNEPLALLVQINFDGINLENFPDHGILQVFVDAKVDYPTEYKIVYYEDTSIKQTPIALEKTDLKDFFIQEPIKIGLKKTTTYMPISDFRFDEICAKSAKNNLGVNITETFDLEDVTDINIDDVYNEFDSPAGNIGGYADFTQTDPRTFEDDKDYTECLVKIDSCLDDKINIGDCGIAWVLINKEDLINKHFEKGLFDWDCC